MAETVDERAHERVREDGREWLGDEEPDRPAPPHRQGARRRVGGVAEVLRDPEHPLERRLSKPLGVVERKGDGGLGDTGRRRHVSDGDPGHPTTLLTWSQRLPPAISKPI